MNNFTTESGYTYVLRIHKGDFLKEKFLYLPEIFDKLY